MVVFLVQDVPSTHIVFELAESRDGCKFFIQICTTSKTLVMFTDKDREAADRFAQPNTVIRTIRLLHSKAPHLASELEYSVREARSADYFIPEKIKHMCKVIDVGISEKLCRKLSCNPTMESGMCKPNMTASYYYVGDDDYDVQCQPACFNTTESHMYSADGNRVPETPMLNFHSGKCRIVPSTMVSYLEKPFYRSDIVYENRKNDMPTGFSRTPSTNPYGCGLDYKANATYCKYYDRILQDDGSCSLEWWEVGLDAVVGMSLINTVKSSVRMLADTESPMALPSNLPKLPESLEAIHTVDGWKKDVNLSFIVPELIHTRTEFTHPYHSRFKRGVRATDGDQGPTVPLHTKNDNTAESVETQQSWVDNVEAVMLSMLECLFTDKSLWISMGVGMVTETMLSRLKDLCKKVVEKLSLQLIKEVPRMGTSVGVNVLRTALKGTCTKIVINKVVAIASKTAIALAKMTVAAVSVVGWFLIATTLLDILFTFWDPYGYNNMFPPTLPHDLMANAERAFRQSAETATMNYEFDHFAALVLTEDEMLSIHVESLMDRLVYLNSLAVNSDGVRLDKGDIINFDREQISPIIDTIHNRTMLRRVRFDPESYEEYNRDFLTRVQINKYANRGAFTSMTVASILVFTGMYSLGVVFTLLTLIVWMIARLQLYDSTILNCIRFRQSKISRS